ncbi:HEAT repeat domain-containing protein [Pseudoblastomonas halimionae]|uniref:HEAT repeat domain-containing protein n=1 Tax=Alteriqipengyuania halimionae TaxID=1926630 RepID=A0A6I4U7N2_9SPHN|nr:HEAT repeat domain-containing protein [Alteriqipengyuania halimionae]MXP10391.1 hypothetical protein [Alteriqipengyuania halimionae]
MVQAIIFFSTAIALGMCLYMAWLLFGRWRTERMASRLKTVQREITRHYLARATEVNTEASVDVAPRAWSPALRLQSVSHLLHLLRGGDKERLLDIAEADGLFQTALTRVKSRNTATRRSAIRVLEQFGSHQCVASLTGVMANDPVPEIRVEAAGALASLGRLPSVRDTISLLELRSLKPLPLHKAILRSIAPRDAAQFAHLLATDLPVDLRVVLLDALGWSGKLEMVDKLVEASRDEDLAVREAALLAVGRLGHAGRGEWVIERLGDREPRVRASAAQVCGALGLVRAIDRLRELESDTSSWVRMHVEEALRKLTPITSRTEAS